MTNFTINGKKPTPEQIALILTPDQATDESRPAPAPELLTTRDYQDAIFAQSACNLSGIVHSLSKKMSRIRASNDAGPPEEVGTLFINRHPICRMFIYQMFYLAFGVEPGSASEAEISRLYYEASSQCYQATENVKTNAAGDNTAG